MKKKPHLKKTLALSAQDQKKLARVFTAIQDNAQRFIGYPCNLDFDYSELFPFLYYAINNVGDPFVSSNYSVNTHEFEREVLEFFADLTQAGDDYWGYVTNGGTEGNMYGLYLARELYPEGIVYFSQDTHYSVAKILRILHMKNIMIRSSDHGDIDYDDLKETIRIKRDIVPIIMANIGTTMTGAVDHIEKIRGILEELAISTYYIHCDAALGGLLLPFMKGAPAFDFSAGIDSLSISGHKFIGSPIPCGVTLARRKHVDRIARSIEYVGTLDTTLTGSRNGITPLFLWYAIRQWKRSGLQERVTHCCEVADYAVTALKHIGYSAWRNAFATTVVFKKPRRALIKKWQLASYKDIAHIVIMPHITKQHVDAFIEDLKNETGSP